MATEIKEKPPETAAKVEASSPSFGAYAGAAGASGDEGITPLAKTKNAPDFANNDKRWLRELGVTTTNPIDFDKAWSNDTDRKRLQTRKWSETYGGRVAIRSVSRAVVGAAFFAAAQVYAGRAMKDYTPDGPLPKELWKKPLHFITKCIDKSVGQGIFKVVKAVNASGLLGKDRQARSDAIARKTVTFRGTRSYGYGKDAYAGIKVGDSILGRSVGHEAVMITFDFATMSFGDYMTRYVLGLFDPNAKVKWMKDGKINVPKALKDVFYNLWRGVTYAAGEDMAVAFPYIYGLRWQRNIINKFSPGFIHDSDSALNGGSFKIREVDAQGKFITYQKGKDGKLIPSGVAKDIKIVGNYQLEGMLDLMGRFSWYNVGTKMFRDAYTWLGTNLSNWWKGDRQVRMPSIDPASLKPGNLLHAVARGGRYVVRTTIKVMMYMLPATFFFYITRTPQSKYIGMAVHPDKGPLGFTKDGAFNFIQADGSYRKQGSAIVPDEYHTAVDFEGEGIVKEPKNERGEKITEIKGRFHNLFSPERINNGYEHRFEPFAKMENDRWYDKYVNKIGRLCRSGGDVLNQVLMPVGKKLGVHTHTINEFSRKYVNASIAYTPYFMAKTDILSASWDTRRMDMAIDRMLGGLVHFRWGEFREGVSEIFRTTLWEPFPDAKREEMAQKATLGDTEKRSNEAFQVERSYDSGTSNDAGPDNNQTSFVTEEMKTQRPTLNTARRATAPKPRAANWTDATKQAPGQTSTAIH